MHQNTLMKVDPAYGTEKPYPSHAQQFRVYHGDLAWLFNPWAGTRRDPADIGTDPFGHMIRDAASDRLRATLTINISASADTATPLPRFTALDANGKPCEPGNHVAVYDSETRLIWPVAYAGDGDGEELSWKKAEEACKAITLFGLQFRLPTRRELVSLVDDTRRDPAIDVTYFPGTKPNYHWSSSDVVGNPQLAWGVSFYYGSVDGYLRDYDNFARAVAGPVSALPGQ